MGFGIGQAKITSLKSKSIPSLPIELPSPYKKVKSMVDEALPLADPSVDDAGWMREAGAINTIMSRWWDDYSAAGGRVQGSASDSWYPGVHTEDYQIRGRQRASTIQADGYIRVDSRDGSKVGEADLYDRSWVDGKGAFVIHTMITNGVQWSAILGQILEYVSVPNSKKLSVPTVEVGTVGFMSLPLVFSYTLPPLPTPAMVIYSKVKTPHAGNLNLTLWNSRKKTTSSKTIKLTGGSQKVVARIRGSPVIPTTGYIEMEFDGFSQGVAVDEIRTSPPTIPT